MAQKIAGLDIGSHSIKAAVLESTYRGWELIGYHEMSIATGYVETKSLIDKIAPVDAPSSPPEEETNEDEADENGEAEDTAEVDDDEADAFDPERDRLRLVLQQFIRRYGNDWDSIYTAFDADRISLKALTVPFSDTRKIDATLAFNLEDTLPFQLADKLIDYQVVEHTPNSARLLAGILDREAIEDYLANFSDTGKEPRGVIIDGLALGNLFLQFATEEQRQGCHALIDIGHRKTSICLILDGVISFIRSVPFGGQDLTQALATAHGMDFEAAETFKREHGFLRSANAEADETPDIKTAETLETSLTQLIRQIKLTFKAHATETRRTVDTLCLTGGSSHLRNIEEFLAEQIGKPVACYAPPLEKFGPLAESSEDIPRLSAALGMAFAGLSGSRLKRLNFRKGEFAFKGDFEFWKGRFAHLGISMAVIFLFFLISLWSQFRVLSNQDEVMTTAIADNCKQILGKEVSDPKICVSQMMEVIGNQGGGGSKLKPETSTLDLYDELISRMMTDNTVVDLQDLEITDKKIKLKGDVDGIPSVGIIVENLKQYDCFRSINQGPTRSSVREGKIQFSLNINVDCGSAKK